MSTINNLKEQLQLNTEIHKVSNEGKQSDQSEHIGKDINCPRKHGLNLFITGHDGYGCDVCKNRVAKGANLYGCRICNFDACFQCIHHQEVKYSIISIQSEMNFHNYVHSKTNSKLVICNFTPSKDFIPIFQALANNYGDQAIFLKICQEEQENDRNWFHQYQQTQYIPEFHFYQNRKLLDICHGADQEIVEGYIRKHLFNETFVEPKREQLTESDNVMLPVVYCSHAACRNRGFISCDMCCRRFCGPHMIRYIQSTGIRVCVCVRIPVIEDTQLLCVQCYNKTRSSCVVL